MINLGNPYGNIPYSSTGVVFVGPCPGWSCSGERWPGSLRTEAHAAALLATNAGEVRDW